MGGPVSLAEINQNRFEVDKAVDAALSRVV